MVKASSLPAIDLFRELLLVLRTKPIGDLDLPFLIDQKSRGRRFIGRYRFHPRVAVLCDLYVKVRFASEFFAKAFKMGEPRKDNGVVSL